ncbi:S26 family signal peptidase [Spongiactinospora sp. 9N601]|uniref:S26 family signal peptidase n=1 Tax=Spongiactinospora sp. 9N601 TaxID=3375149 RepID=UPI003792B3E6
MRRYRALAVGVVLLAMGGGLLRRLRKHYLLVTVQGSSMAPGLSHGDRLLVRRRPFHQVRRGQIVLIRNSREPHGRLRPGETVNLDQVVPLLIKRVLAVSGDPMPGEEVQALSLEPGPTVPFGKLIVLGDNPEDSYDSRQHGYFSGGDVVGVAVFPAVSLPICRRTILGDNRAKKGER